MTTVYAAAITWGFLVFSTPMSIIVFSRVRKKHGILQARLVSLCAMAVALIVCLAALKISATIRWVNVFAFDLAYIAYCYLAVSAYQVGNPLLRVAAIIILHMPVILGYFMGTVGVLALLFLVGEKVEPPLKVERLSESLYCEITGWGMAASDSGYAVSLLKSWQSFPFMAREVYSASINETHPSDGQTGGWDCSSAFAAYQKLDGGDSRHRMR